MPHLEHRYRFFWLSKMHTTWDCQVGHAMLQPPQLVSVLNSCSQPFLPVLGFPSQSPQPTGQPGSIHVPTWSQPPKMSASAMRHSSPGSHTSTRSSYRPVAQQFPSVPLQQTSHPLDAFPSQSNRFSAQVADSPHRPPEQEGTCPRSLLQT